MQPSITRTRGAVPNLAPFCFILKIPAPWNGVFLDKLVCTLVRWYEPKGCPKIRSERDVVKYTIARKRVPERLSGLRHSEKEVPERRCVTKISLGVIC
jgi:hypothetical protein